MPIGDVQQATNFIFKDHHAPFYCDKYGYDKNVNVKKIGVACYS
jgi:hypothetical protein